MIIHLSPPHQHGGDSIQASMLSVIFALLPASLCAVWLFGWLAVWQILTCIGVCMLSEWVAMRMMKRVSRLHDGSAALTGLLLALILPAATPWWMSIMGAVFAIILGKQVYGGLGYNPFNPALSARVILLISFPLAMTSWLIPAQAMPAGVDLYDISTTLALFFGGPEAMGQTLDAITMASPLGYVKDDARQGISVALSLQTHGYSYLDAFIGKETGSMGETSALALLIGGIILISRNTIRWHIPVSYLLTVAVLAAIFNTIDGDRFAPPLFHLLAGGLMLCAFFMATDPVSSPMGVKGHVVFGVGCGVLTWVIRTWGGYPEGAMFAVLLMNCAVPFIDHYFRPRVYGHQRKTP
ncbi:MAG: RnfABCDGE type electron transport complex subunit D [Mariprofundaceae bacterium]|nr:RnfABCDGE type electron transport complex subunit D [Mariprofundaceae bacterium]